MIAEVAHGRKEQCDACLVAPDVCGLLANLGHENTIPFRIQFTHQGMVRIQLIAQDQHQPTYVRRRRRFQGTSPAAEHWVSGEQALGK
jgi:hypothetical protein